MSVFDTRPVRSGSPTRCSAPTRCGAGRRYAVRAAMKLIAATLSFAPTGPSLPRPIPPHPIPSHAHIAAPPPPTPRPLARALLEKKVFKMNTFVPYMSPQRNDRISSPPNLDPVKLLESLMKQKRLRSVDLAAQLGISKSHMSNILCYQRALSKEVIRKLAARFEVDQERFNRPYNLVPQRKTGKPARRPGQPQNDPPPKKGPRDTAILDRSGYR